MFESSFSFVITHWLGTFTSLNDLMSSFMFNMLANSLSINNVVQNINTYKSKGQGPQAAGQIATLIRILLTFQSSSAATLGKEELKA